MHDRFRRLLTHGATLTLVAVVLAQPPAAAPAHAPSAPALAAGADAARAPAAARPGGLAAPGWQLRWSADASVDGLRAFETVEDDRANSHPAGQPHIFVEGNNYRFNMHLVDRDSLTDRQRQEVRGMRSDVRDLLLLRGETWRITYSMFIPSSLKATTSFTHIMQTKAPGAGSLPMLVTSLRRHSGVPKIELRATNGSVLIGAVDLVPLQNRWIDVELEMGIGDSARVRWVLRTGTSTVIDVTRTGIDTWLEDRVRPKWGIYRSLGDTSGSLQDCHLLIRNMRAYEWSESVEPPTAQRLEAENATISQGVVERTNPGFTGTGYVNPTNVVGSSVQWTVNATAAATATLTFWYANGTTGTRPMDVTVNGALVADELALIRTASWTDWDSRTIRAPLRVGANTIRVTSTTSSGGPNLDSLAVQVPPLPPTAGVDYQAEDATISQGMAESNWPGFTGTGFVNTNNVVGSYVEWSVTAPAAVTATLTFRYANGSTANRPMDITVGTVLVRDELAFNPTGAWSTWQTVTLSVPLAAGTNLIRATSTTAGGGPNLDKITVA